MLTGEEKNKDVEDISKITVITVCYNAVNEIEQTILSVINQTYDNIEYIVVDGGSKDGTVDIIQKYEDRITKWISEPDKGIYDAMNKGIRMATGEWINFMNAGDRFAKNNILNDVTYYFSKNEIDVIYGNCGFLNTQTVEIARPFWEHPNKYHGLGFCHQTAFVKSAICRNYIFNISYHICADFDFFYRLYQKGYKFYYINTTIANIDTCGISLSLANRAEVYRQNAAISGELSNHKYRMAIVWLNLLNKMPKCIRKYVGLFYFGLK